MNWSSNNRGWTNENKRRDDLTVNTNYMKTKIQVLKYSCPNLTPVEYEFGWSTESKMNSFSWVLQRRSIDRYVITSVITRRLWKRKKVGALLKAPTRIQRDSIGCLTLNFAVNVLASFFPSFSLPICPLFIGSTCLSLVRPSSSGPNQCLMGFPAERWLNGPTLIQSARWSWGQADQLSSKTDW